MEKKKRWNWLFIVFLKAANLLLDTSLSIDIIVYLCIQWNHYPLLLDPNKNINSIYHNDTFSFTMKRERNIISYKVYGNNLFHAQLPTLIIIQFSL